MQLDSTTLFTSALYPEVTARVRSISRGARIKLERELSALRNKEREIEQDAADLDKLLQPFRDEAKTGPCTCEHEDLRHDFESKLCLEKGCRCRYPNFPPDLIRRFDEIIYRRQTLNFLESEPAYIRAMVVSLDGVSIDGKPASIDSLIESGDDALVAEIGAFVRKQLGLDPEERKNSSPPSTSREKADGETSGSTAPTASEIDSTPKTSFTSAESPIEIVSVTN